MYISVFSCQRFGFLGIQALRSANRVLFGRMLFNIIFWAQKTIWGIETLAADLRIWSLQIEHEILDKGVLWWNKAIKWANNRKIFRYDNNVLRDRVGEGWSLIFIQKDHTSIIEEIICLTFLIGIRKANVRVNQPPGNAAMI